MKNFNKLCAPAKIYFAIAVIATIIALLNGVHMMYALCKMIFAFIWTFVLGWLCNKGYSSISWLLVLLPYIIIALAMFNIYYVSEEERQFMRAIKLQGPYGQEAFVEGFKKPWKKGLSNAINDSTKVVAINEAQKAERDARRAEEQARQAEEQAEIARQQAELQRQQAELERQQATIVSIQEPVDQPINNDAGVATENSPFGSFSPWLGG